ncbi:AraC family transcriptional regulator [Hyphomicrobium denitrificans 1NES1]|uniref:AraC family transcriptional regulator n=1 Tax=Hyphomicrobium denitrificans 1NES1 TaxID=670307 RepID=N0BGQ1_9HYPH|nr:helix-turn-helix domain-containing protein [Hyphomicrobium denitrificans]AGK59325.1 AraC family transcriptional regulator [Hyphomicrobium denitrificans 1NES1]
MRANVNRFEFVAIQDNCYDDFDLMAQDAREWDIHYQQTGAGTFFGRMTQVILNSLQLGRVRWSPGILDNGTAPPGNWVVALPVSAEGTLHVRGRPASVDQPLFVPAGEDIAFAATGRTDLIVAAIDTAEIERWMQVRRGIDGINRRDLLERCEVTGPDLAQPTLRLQHTLSVLMTHGHDASQDILNTAHSVVLDTVLEIMPSFEVIEPLHRRAKVAAAMRTLLKENIESAITIADICEKMAVRERTLYLACQEAFGKPPKRLLYEMRLNAVRRQLSQPSDLTSVTSEALRFGFLHLGRFAAEYCNQFGERPSETLARARGSSPHSKRLMSGPD